MHACIIIATAKTLKNKDDIPQWSELLTFYFARRRDVLTINGSFRKTEGGVITLKIVNNVISGTFWF